MPSQKHGRRLQIARKPSASIVIELDYIAAAISIESTMGDSETTEGNGRVVIQREGNTSDLLYKVEDSPPFHLSVVFGIQVKLLFDLYHFLDMDILVNTH